MFRASSAHLQEDTVVHMRHMVLPPSTRVLGGLSVHSLSKNSFYDLWPCIVTDSLCIKPTDKPNSNFIGITNLHVSGSISAHHQEFLAVHRLWYILCSYDERLLLGAGWHCRCVLDYSQAHIFTQNARTHTKCYAAASPHWLLRF